MEPKSSSSRWKSSRLNPLNRLRKARSSTKQDISSTDADATQSGPPETQPGNALQSSAGIPPTSAPATGAQAGPTTTGAQESRPCSAGRQASAVAPSQRLWNEAYDSLEKDDDTSKLVWAYSETLKTVLAPETAPQASGSGSDVSTEPKDPTERQEHMRRLVEQGRARVATAYKITKGVGDVAKFVLSAKAMVDLAIQNIPQAALPWAGVCVGLQILLNPASAAESNREGIACVVSKMDWYCSLTEHLLKPDNVGKESFQSILQQLETKLVALYKALLLYQMKSACSFYSNQALVFVRGLANVDDWDAALKTVTDAEETLLKDWDHFNKEQAQSLRRQHVEIAEEMKTLLGDIHHAVQENTAVLQEIHRDEKDTQCLKDLHLTDPRHDKTRIEQTKGGLLAESYCWILDNAEFRRWNSDGQGRLLWIKGDPGKGKTMLLCGIIDELKRRSDTEKDLLSFFFCQGTDSRINSATAVLRGLIYLLLEQQPSLIPHARKKYDHAGKALFEDANALVALSEIFINILQDPGLKSACLVIDALDECVADLPKLLDLVVKGLTASPRVKWIVSSRNWLSIEERLKLDDSRMRLSLELKQNADQVSNAVGVYIDHCVSELPAIQDDKSLHDQVQDALRRKARGTFLWVSLVIHELQDAESYDLLQVIEKVPADLNKVYFRMLGQIQQLNGSSPERCRHVLSTVTAAYRPLHLQELGVLSGLPRDISRKPESVARVVKMCGSFLTIRDDIVYIIHQSAKDFLSIDALHTIFPSGTADVHHSIFSRSLQVLSEDLRRDIYGLVAPGFPIDEIPQPDPDPLAAARYSCVYWVGHLYDWHSAGSLKCLSDLEDGDAILAFLRRCYLYWLEALSLLKSMSQGVLSMAKLEALFQKEAETSQLRDLVRDARRFLLYNKWPIENSPLQTYASALLFSPAHCIIRDLYKQEEPQWITTKPAMEDNWNACHQTLEGHGNWVLSVAISANSTLFASASRDKTVKLWDITTGDCYQTLEGHNDWVLSVAISADSTLIASASQDKTVKLWDTAGNCRQTLEGHSERVNSVAISADSTLIASASYDKTVKLWDTAGNCRQILIGHNDYVNSVAISADSTLIVSASDDWTVKLWDITGNCRQTLEGHSARVNSVAISADSTLIASASNDRTVKLWDTATGNCRQTFKGHKSSVDSVAISADSILVASASWDKTVKLWDIVTGNCYQTLEGHNSGVFSIAISADSTLIVSASYDKTVKFWDIAMGNYRQTLEDHSEAVNLVTISADSMLVVSASGDKTVKLWDVVTGNCYQTLEGHSGWVNSVAISADSTLIVSASDDETVKLWDVATGNYYQALEGCGKRVKVVAISADLTLIALGLSDKSIRLWDVTMGSYRQTFERHYDTIKSVTISADSTFIASASFDKTVKLWNIATGNCYQILRGNGSDGVESVAISADSTLIASSSWDNAVRIWDAATGNCRQTLDIGRVLHKIVFDATSSCLCTDAGTIALDFLLDRSNRLPALESPLTGTTDEAGTPDEAFHFQGYGISPDGTWITWRSQKVIWLPSEYRATRSGVAGSAVVLGCASGRVLFFVFDDEPPWQQRQTAS